MKDSDRLLNRIAETYKTAAKCNKEENARAVCLQGSILEIARQLALLREAQQQ